MCFYVWFIGNFWLGNISNGKESEIIGTDLHGIRGYVKNLYMLGKD